MPDGSSGSFEEESVGIAEFLSSCGISARRICKPDEFLDITEKGGVGILHFSCHNKSRKGEEQLSLGDQTIRIADLRTAEEPFASLVFLNACGTKEGEGGAMDVESWAEAFIDKGAEVVIVTHWEVRNETARTFAREFYQELLHGSATLSSAIGAARDAARRVDVSDPTWLAYCAYGNLNARI